MIELVSVLSLPSGQAGASPDGELAFAAARIASIAQNPGVSRAIAWNPSLLSPAERVGVPRAGDPIQINSRALSKSCDVS